MKTKTTYLVIFMMIFLSACSQTSSPSNQSDTGNPQTAPVSNQEVGDKSSLSSQSTQSLSNAPLSSGILVSRTDTVTEKSELCVIDPANGLPIASAPPLPMGESFSSIRSLDGKTLVTIAYPVSNFGRMHLIDLTTWQDTSLDFDIDGFVGILNFSPDGSYLGIVTWKNGSHIYLVEMRTRELVAQLELKDKFAKVHFTSDSSGLMVYFNRWDSTKNPEILPSVMLLDVPGLKIQWGQALEGVKQGFFAVDNSMALNQPGAGKQFEPGVAFSPTEDKVFIVHADEARLTTVDFGRQSVGTVEITPKLSWLERLLWLDAQPVKAKMLNGTVKSAVVSPNGAVLYATGVTNLSTGSNNESEFESTPLGLQIIDTQSGTELGHYDSAVQSLSLTPDGHWALLYSYQAKGDSSEPSTQVFDTQTQEMKTVVEGTELHPAHRLDGGLVFVSEFFLPNGHQKFSVYDSQFKQVSSFELTNYYFTWQVDPSGW